MVKELLNLPNSHFLNQSTDVQLFRYSTLNNNYEKCCVLYNKLSIEQRQLIDVFHLLLSQAEDTSSYILLLDAPPGTGKSTIIMVLAATLKNPLCYMVYNRNLANLANSYNIITYTCCRFIMKHFKKHYMEAINFFHRPGFLHELLEYIVNEVDNMKSELLTFNVLVLDEYTIVHPLFIIMMYLIAIKYKKNIIFVGDKNQQSSISRSKYHSKSNFSLAQVMSDKIIIFKEQLRIDDIHYNVKIQKIRAIVDGYNDNVRMNFHYLYLLFQLFEEKFYLKENINNIYFSQFHRNIKQRITKLMKLPECTCIPFFYLVPTAHELRKHELPPSNKFMNVLPLVPHYIYLYTDNFNSKHEVEFLNYYKGRITVKRLDINDNIVLDYEPINAKTPRSYTDQERLYLQNDQPHTIYQFPIKPMCLTYHAVQGQTISGFNVELDLDANTFNAIYVGLTRVRHGNQLRKLHTTQFLNLVLTHHMNDEYFYKANSTYILNYIKNLILNKPNDIVLDKNKFQIVTTIRFNYANIDCRILKDKYIKDHENTNTGFEVMLEFIKKHKTDIFKPEIRALFKDELDKSNLLNT